MTEIKQTGLFTVEAGFEFDSAHFLLDHAGKCRNIHGHRWKIIVAITSNKVQTSGPENGMVIDFKRLKGVFNVLIEELDHVLIIRKGSISNELYRMLVSHGFIIRKFDFSPTAENMAQYIFTYMQAAGYAIARVDVYETPNNKASYSER